nr:hypothetical protein [Halobacterium salinarum]
MCTTRLNPTSETGNGVGIIRDQRGNWKATERVATEFSPAHWQVLDP